MLIPVLIVSMVGLSEQDMERIQEFNKRPWYEKSPDVLLPEEKQDDTSDTE